MLRSTLILALLLPQDEATVRSTIEKLEDDAFDVRDRAQKDLVRMGEAALPALRKTIEEARGSNERGELLLRAEAAVREIELAAKSKSVCPEAPLFTLKAIDRLGALGDEISKATRLGVEYGGIDRAFPLTFSTSGIPLTRLLDELCLGRDALTWEYRDEKVCFKAEKHVARPSSYSGAFRTRLGSLKATRSTDFKARTATVHAVLEADHDPTVKPSKDKDIEILRAADDKGSALEVREGDEPEEFQQGNARVRFGRVWARGGLMPGQAAGGETFTLKGLHPDARKVTLHGRVHWRFPLDRSEIKLARPQGGETKELGEFTMSLQNSGGRRWTLAFKKTKGQTTSQTSEELNRRLDAESATAVDEDGMEHAGTLTPTGDTVAAQIVIVNGQVQESIDSLSYAFQFPTLKNKAVKELRFRFADKVLEKSVPFTLENVDLP